MAVKQNRQYQRRADSNPLEFDNQFGGAGISDPYDGSRPYVPFNQLGLFTDQVGGGTGGGGASYTPPTPPNSTFVPPSNQQDLLNGNIIVNLSAESLSSSEKVDVEFLENDISKGISNNTRIVYSPALSFGDKKIYKATSSGKILTNYYEVAVVKTFVSSNYPFDDVIRWQPGNDRVVPDPNTFGTSRYPYWDQNNGTYNYTFDFNRGNRNTPFTRFEEIYTENIQVTEYELQDDGTYAVSSTKEHKSTGDVINLTFYFREKKRTDNPVDDVPVDTSSQLDYEIAFGNNFGLE